MLLCLSFFLLNIWQITCCLNNGDTNDAPFIEKFESQQRLMVPTRDRHGKSNLLSPTENIGLGM